MKKRIFWLAFLVLAAYGVSRLLPGESIGTDGTVELLSETTGQSPQRSARAGQPERSVQRGGETIQVTEEQIYRGELLLINKDQPVPQGAEPEAVLLAEHRELVRGFALLDDSVRLPAGLARKFTAMAEAAERDGVRHFIVTSGYRDNEKQGELYASMGADYAMPAGYSEHNLGLALDIGSTQGEMKDAPEGKWLKDNAWQHGFILRYPEDKTDITGIQYEPWHFRYVGMPHSAVMHKENMVLEEYLAYLRERKTIDAVVDGQHYTIAYYPVSGKTTIAVPADGRYTISGDNMGGVIVTALADRNA